MKHGKPVFNTIFIGSYSQSKVLFLVISSLHFLFVSLRGTLDKELTDIACLRTCYKTPSDFDIATQKCYIYPDLYRRNVERVCHKIFYLNNGRSVYNICFSRY